MLLPREQSDLNFLSPRLKTGVYMRLEIHLNILSFIFLDCSVSEAVSVSLVSYRLLGAFLRFVLVHGKNVAQHRL